MAGLKSRSIRDRDLSVLWPADDAENVFVVTPERSNWDELNTVSAWRAASLPPLLFLVA